MLQFAYHKEAVTEQKKKLEFRTIKIDNTQYKIHNNKNTSIVENSDTVLLNGIGMFLHEIGT